MKRRGKLKTSHGAHALRIELMNAGYHLERAHDAVQAGMRRLLEVTAVDQLAVAVKALRAIANSASADNRSRGVAKAALEKMRVTQ